MNDKAYTTEQSAARIDELKQMWNNTQHDILPEGASDTPIDPTYILRRIAELEGKQVTNTGSVMLEDLIEEAGRDLRSLSWHSDGRVIAKSGAGAKNPRKIYHTSTAAASIVKLIQDNKS